MTKKHVIIISDCKDVAFNEMVWIMKQECQRLGHENVEIELVAVTEFSIINAAFLTRLMAEHCPTGTIFSVVINPQRHRSARVYGQTSNGLLFFGANTGALGWFLDRFGVKELYEVHDPGFISFGGKYVHAPNVARLVAGVPFDSFGKQFPVSQLTKLNIADGTVVHIDNFGLMKIKGLTPKYQDGEILKVSVNGGKHAGNGLDFCEFMIIPKGVEIIDNVRTASEVYLDLRDIIESSLGRKHILVGCEGGFSPDISDIEIALNLISQAINKRNSGKCDIAIDVAANNFSQHHVSDSGTHFEYQINGNRYTTDSLLLYYENLILKFPNIVYLEDPFHEEDFDGWKKLSSRFQDKILVVADDLTVSNILHLEKLKICFNACILKINQIGSMTGLVKAYEFCITNNVRTIISQRSGETDSNIIAHMSIGLGSDYIKAGAPARERIVKYNALIRLWHMFNNL